MSGHAESARLATVFVARFQTIPSPNYFLLSLTHHIILINQGLGSVSRSGTIDPRISRP